MRNFLLPAAALLTASLSAQQPLCHTTEKQNAWFEAHPELKASFEKLQADAALVDQQMFQQGYQKMSAESAAASAYTIPVVFHILHTGGPENISDAQVKNAVDILTRDFNRTNADTSDVVGPFKNKIGDAQITFALATKDNNGNCTNGIVRHYDKNTDWDSDFSDYKYSWPSSRYLNIYVVRTIESGAAGYTYLPGSGVPNYADAIVILSTYVGSIGTGQVGLSRALTHEVGHWLNLPHTWGGTNQPGVSCGDDGVSDTPVTKGFTSCNLGNAKVCNAGITENMQNYMDYAYCQRMFTQGQAARMQQALNSSVGSRNNLSSPSNLSVTGIDNPLTACAPVLEIGVSGYTVCAGKPLSFLSFTSNANPTSYAWTAGNGAVIQNAGTGSPLITFVNPGTTTVTCVVGNSNGSDAASLVISVMEPWADITGAQGESFEQNVGPLPVNWKMEKSGAQGWSTTTVSASDGFRSMFVKGESMSADAVTILETPSFDFKSNPGALFTFKYAYRRASAGNKDMFILQASSDCGGSWVNVYSPSASQLALNSGGTGSSLFVPTADQWKFYDQLVKHPNFSGFLEESNVRFRFYFREDPNGSGFGNRFYLDEINFSVPVGVNELTRSFNLNLYPNPSAGAFTIDFSLPDPSSVGYTVFALSGAEVMALPAARFEPGTHSLIFNADQQLAPGIYFVNVAINGATMSKKVVVQ